MSGDLRHLIREAGGPPAELDVEHLRHVAERRRRRTSVLTAAVVLLALVVPASWLVVTALDRPPSWVHVAERPSVLPESRAQPLVAFDPVGSASPGARSLTDVAANLEPRVLPRRFLRCDGPVHAGSITATRFCTPDGAIIRLLRGPHEELTERGDPVSVGTRTGYVTVTEDGWRLLTVSDSDTMTDRHYRLEAPAAYDAETLAAIVWSIPAFSGDPAD